MLQWVTGGLLWITGGNYGVVSVTGRKWGCHRRGLQRLWGSQGAIEVPEEDYREFGAYRGPRRGLQGLWGSQVGVPAGN